MSKMMDRKEKAATAEFCGEAEFSGYLAPPRRHVAEGASASEIRKGYGITDKELAEARRKLKKFGLL